MQPSSTDDRPFDPLIFWVSASFFLTSANSAALALSMFVSGKENPGRNLRAFWGVALGAVVAVLAGTGGLRVIQTASIATAFPLMFLLLALLYGTFRGLSRHRASHAAELVTLRSSMTDDE